MTLFQITSFIQIVESKSLSHAAEELYVSQSSLSKQLHALEEEIGHILLDRKGRTISLTSAGRLFLAFAVEVQKSYCSLQENLNPPKEKKLVVILISSFADMFLPLIHEFMGLHPDIEVILHENNEDELPSAMKEFQGDVAFSWDSSASDFGREYTSVELFSSRLCIGTCENHPLAKHESISLSDLKDQKFIMFYQPVRQRYLLDKCSEYDFVPHIKHNICTPATFYHFLREGEGIAFIQKVDKLPSGKPASEFPNIPALNGIHLVPLKENIWSSVLMFYRHNRLSPAGKSFLDFLQGKIQAR